MPQPCLRDEVRRGFLESDPRKPWSPHPALGVAGVPGTPPQPISRIAPHPQSPRLPTAVWSIQAAQASVSPSGHGPPCSSPGEGSRVSHCPLSHPTHAQTPQPRPTPGSPPTRGGAYLSNTAGVVLGLGGGPEQARGCRGRPQLQDPAEVRGVGGGPARGGGRRRGGFLALGGQAELLGGPGGGQGDRGTGSRALSTVLMPAPPCKQLSARTSFPASHAEAPGAAGCHVQPLAAWPVQARQAGPGRRRTLAPPCTLHRAHPFFSTVLPQLSRWAPSLPGRVTHTW